MEFNNVFSALHHNIPLRKELNDKILELRKELNRATETYPVVIELIEADINKLMDLLIAEAEKLSEIDTLEEDLENLYDIRSLCSRKEEQKGKAYKEDQLMYLCTERYHYPNIKTREDLDYRIEYLENLKKNKRERFYDVVTRINELGSEINQLPDDNESSKVKGIKIGAIRLKLINNQLRDKVYPEDKLLLADIDDNQIEMVKKYRFYKDGDSLKDYIYDLAHREPLGVLFSYGERDDNYIQLRKRKCFKLFEDIELYINPISDYFDGKKYSKGYNEFKKFIERWKKCKKEYIIRHAYVKATEELYSLKDDILNFTGFTNEEMIGILEQYYNRVKDECSLIIRQDHGTYESLNERELKRLKVDLLHCTSPYSFEEKINSEQQISQSEFNRVLINLVNYFGRTILLKEKIKIEGNKGQRNLKDQGFIMGNPTIVEVMKYDDRKKAYCPTISQLTSEALHDFTYGEAIYIKPPSENDSEIGINEEEQEGTN